MDAHESEIERDLATITKKSSRKRLVSTFQRSDEVKNAKNIYNLSVEISKTASLWSEVDEFHHNAFYYAIRSNMTHLLNILIEKGQNKNQKEELDEILSKAYRELKLRNVFVTREMDFFVQSKILDIRFFHESADETTGNSWIHIEKRIELVVENINIIKSSYWDKEVDEIFILRAEFIAKNIHVLKFLLKSTYDRLPWEEIEFCLAVFIRCSKKRVVDNLFYCCVLSKEALLQHLENFSKFLDSERNNFKNSDVIKLAKILKLKRTDVVNKIIKNHPEFQDLYADYESIRDHHSLETKKVCRFGNFCKYSRKRRTTACRKGSSSHGRAF
ncbi:uncharacterized protein CEXT_769551 [Caerostris extrusa]|uniref:Uncharacterized protein n=1 Tax=Caerostris extrusa TaxID=172846 RepID=A0AAV4U374_CAEEX|nr:uncharacterized protein CEXT_769551 [Caerostris extrusa]